MARLSPSRDLMVVGPSTGGGGKNALRGANMMKARVLRTTSLSLCFLLSVFTRAHSQAPNEAPSPLSAISHDFTTWLNHVAGNGDHNHWAGHHPSPLPRPRPAGELASKPVASNKEWSEFVPPAGASKKTMSTFVQIND